MRSLFLVWLTLLAGSLRGEISAPRPAAPEAVPVSVTVRRGGHAEIVLRAYGKANQPLRFKLRSRPALGRIFEPKNITEETAVVVYEHGDVAEPLTDRFTYVVQSSNGVSAPAAVDLKIVDDAPILVVPDEIDFKTVQPGAVGTREITVENRGGGLVTGALLPPENWRVEGSPNYRLDRGQAARFKLAFQPGEEREYRADLRYSSHPDRTTALRGVGAYPITVHPPKLVLIATPNSATRVGRVELENRTDTAQTVQITADERLPVPPQIVLPANERAAFPVAASTANLSAFDDQIVLSTPQFSVNLPVHVDAAGPILHTNSEPTILTKTNEASAAGQVTVENRGGTRAFVQAAVGAPFHLRAEDRAFPLEPGEKRAVQLTVQPVDDRALRAELNFSSGEVQAVAQVRAEGLPKAAVAAAPRVPPPLALLEIPAAPETLSTVPPISQWTVSAITTNSADLAWTAPAGPPLRYVVELRYLSLNANRDLQVDWLSINDLEIRQSGRQASAPLRRLNPGTLYSLRLRSIDAQGQRSEPSRIIQFSTLPPTPFHWRKLLFPLALLLAGYGLWRRFFPKSESGETPAG